MSLAKQPSSLLFSKLARTAMAAARHGTHAGSAAPDPGGGRKAAGGAAPAAPRGTAPPARREERELCRPLPTLPPFSGAVARRLRAPQPAPGSGIALREQRSAAGLALAGHCVHKDGTVGPGTPLWAQTQRWHPRTWVLHRPCAWTCHLMPSPSVFSDTLLCAGTACVPRRTTACHRYPWTQTHAVDSNVPLCAIIVCLPGRTTMVWTTTVGQHCPCAGKKRVQMPPMCGHSFPIQA